MASAIRNKIIKIIKKTKLFSEKVLDDSNLSLNLGIDSLAFIQLILKIEKTFSITFNILEIEKCLIVKELISITQNKIKETQYASKTVDKQKKLQQNCRN